MTRRTFAACGLGFLPALTGVAQSSGEASQRGEAWLALIDNQKYADSWSEASSYFRARVPRQQWIDMVKGVRAPLGSLKSRALKNTTTAKSLPGAPDGEYTVLQYETSYQNKANAVETLTLMNDSGKWRCAGYYIR